MGKLHLYVTNRAKVEYGTENINAPTLMYKHH